MGDWRECLREGDQSLSRGIRICVTLHTYLGFGIHRAGDDVTPSEFLIYHNHLHLVKIIGDLSAS